MKINSIGKQNFTADLAFFDKSANNKTLKKSGYMLSMAFKRMTEDIPNRKMLVTVNDYSDKDTFELMDSEFNVLTSSEFKFSKLLDNLNYEQATNRLKDIFSVLTNKANNIEDIKSLKRMRKEFQAMLDELEYSIKDTKIINETNSCKNIRNRI